MKTSLTGIQIWGMPILLGLISASGLIAALLFDGIGGVMACPCRAGRERSLVRRPAYLIGGLSPVHAAVNLYFGFGLRLCFFQITAKP